MKQGLLCSFCAVMLGNMLTRADLKEIFTTQEIYAIV